MKHFLIIVLTIVSFKSFAQTESGFDKSGNVMYLDYIDKDNAIKDLRIRKAGDKAISLLTFVPFGFIKSDVGDGIEEVNTDHRITERLVPNYKYYLSDKNTVSASLFIKSLSSKYSGSNPKDAASTKDLLNEGSNSGRGIYLRTAFDRHLALRRMRTFDMDFYAGASLSLGLLSTTKYSNVVKMDDSYTKTTTSGNGLGIGMDVYGGMAFQFERWSLGAEILSFGFDHSRGFGADKTKIETKSTTVETITYKNGSYSELSKSESLTSMYRGLRIVFSYYF